MPSWKQQLFFLVSALLLAPLLAAQVHGVPASVSSFGFGGNFSSAPGVPASVTSLGPMGFNNGPVMFGNCCFQNFHFRGRSFVGNAPTFPSRHHSRRGFFPTGFSYAVPYTQVLVVPDSDMFGESDAYAEDEDQGGATIFDRRAVLRKPRQERILEENPEPVVSRSAAAPAPEPAREQPSTLLVYRDGHQSEIQNYAIVGDTLFNLSDDRSYRILLADLDLTATRKANADRGIDFEVPPDSSR